MNLADRDIPLGIAAPNWCEHYVEGHAIWLPFDHAQISRTWLSIDRDHSGESVLARLTQIPSSLDYLGAWIDETAVGLAPLGIQGTASCASRLPFDGQAKLLSALQSALSSNVVDFAFHAGLADRLYGGDLCHQIKKILQSGSRKALFSEQTLLALTRIVIAVGGTNAEQISREDQDEAASRLLLAANGLPMAKGDVGDNDGSPFAMTDALLQISGLGATEWLASALGRTRRIFKEISTSAVARTRPDYCPIDSWLRAAYGGLGVDEQIALAVLVIGDTSVFETQNAATLAAPGMLVDTFTQRCRELKVATESALGLLSATRSWYQDRFIEIEEQHELTTDQSVQGWNRVPLDERPLLRLENELLVWSPQSLTSWMTDGLYYRALNAAPNKRSRAKLLTFYGWLFEEHIRALFKDAYRDASLPGTGRVIDPFKYAKGQNETTDIILDFGHDLVFVEVYSGRLNLKSRIVGDTEGIARNLSQMIIDKAGELGDRINDFVEGAYDLPDVDRSLVQRIWPIVVVGSPLMLNEALGSTVGQRLGERLAGPRNQPVSVLCPGDVDVLCGLVEQGLSLLDILSRRAGAYQWLDFGRLLRETPHLPAVAASRLSRQNFDEVFAALTQLRGLDPAVLERMLHQAATPTAVSPQT